MTQQDMSLNARIIEAVRKTIEVGAATNAEKLTVTFELPLHPSYSTTVTMIPIGITVTYRERDNIFRDEEEKTPPK
jgi:hypothetical protein